MIDIKEIGSTIKQLRVKRGLTQSELGEKINVKKARISKIERGDLNLTLGALTSIFKALGITIKIEIGNVERS